MSRKKLSEFRAKSLIYGALGQDYHGLEIDTDDDWQAALDALDAGKRYVVKVDQAEKGRFKKGLVKLDRKATQVKADIQELAAKGYRYLLVEEYKPHDPADERYLTIERLREGTRVSFSGTGGVDVEEHGDKIKNALYEDKPIEGLDLPSDTLGKLAKTFDDNYFSFLEINPYITEGSAIRVLDAAVEADDEATFFEESWTADDLRSPRSGSISEEELAVQELGDNSQASFSLEVINPDGSIWVLLSGGGASVVVADEVHNLGFGGQLGNYGEYSGNPNTEETRLYTEQVIKLMLKSKAGQKALIIGGGVANFTDVRQTFKGVIEALEAHQAELMKQGCAVYVRRGGPHEKEGLELIKAYLDKAGIPNLVAGPEMLLADIVGHAVGKAEAK